MADKLRFTPLPVLVDQIDNPFADVLREVFWDLEQLIGIDWGELYFDETEAALRDIRDKAGATLHKTPTAITPLLERIRPKIWAVIKLIQDSNDPDTALDLLLELVHQIEPSPADKE